MLVRRRWIACGLAAAATVGAMVGPSSVHAGGGVRPLITDLNSPKGVDVAADGAVIVAQGAFGPPAPVLRFDPSAPPRDRVTEITEPFSLVDVAISPLDGTGWAIGADQFLYQQLADGTIVPQLDIAGYQATDPDPVDKDDPPNPIESNPYGLTVMPNGDALVADAAGNDVIRVTPAGVANTVARLDIEVTSTSHIPGFPVPALPAEAVPTSVTIGQDGAIYVGELKGFPFTPGASKVWRIEPDAVDAWCSVNMPSPDCTVYKDGLTAIQDIDIDPRNARLYVLTLAEAGVLAFEEGFATGEFPPAALFELRNIGRWNEKFLQLAEGQMSQPGGVAVAPNGQVYVTDGMFSSGRLLRITR